MTWARVNVSEVRMSNAISLMQIDMQQLDVLQTQMDNLTMQTTLLIGFGVSMWAGETLVPLVEDFGQLCIYKTW